MFEIAFGWPRAPDAPDLARAGAARTRADFEHLAEPPGDGGYQPRHGQYAACRGEDPPPRQAEDEPVSARADGIPLTWDDE